MGVAALYGMGVLVAGDGSFTRCIGWPLGIIIDADHAAPLQILRVILAVALIGVFFWLRSLPVLSRWQLSLCWELSFVLLA